MTVREAEKVLRKTYGNGNLTEESKFELTEALKYLIEETHDPEYMMNLGGIYYEDRQFDLALKYYEMAAGYDYDVAYECLGYIWYYGRTGEVDHKRAFENYSKAAEVGNVTASYKVADMYKNGYYVEKDYDKYCRIIEDLYPRVRNAEWLIRDLYDLIECDTSDLKLYDLHHILKTPCKVAFMYGNKKYEVESVEENGKIIIRFGKKWYQSIRDFFAEASIGSKKLVTIPYELHDFEIK